MPCLKPVQEGGIEYDITTGLFSSDPKAIEWGERLFGYYKIHSEAKLHGNYAL